MPEPPEPDGHPAECDFEKIENIISALDYLRGEAAKTGVDDLRAIIDSAFHMVLTAYTLMLRYEGLKTRPTPGELH